MYKFKMFQCVVCSEPSTVKCSDCNVSYCGNECIDTHWTTHQYECIGGKRGRDEDTIVTLQFKDGTREVAMSKLEPFETLYNLLEDTNDNILPVPNVLASDFDELLANHIFRLNFRDLSRIVIAANYLGDTEFVKNGMQRFAVIFYRVDDTKRLRAEFGIKDPKFTREQLLMAEDLTIVPVFDYVLTEEERTTTVLGIPNDLFVEYVFPRVDPHRIIQLRELHVRFWNVVNRYIVQRMRAELPKIAFASDATLLEIATVGRLDDVSGSDDHDTYLLTREEWSNLGAYARFKDIAIAVIKKWGSFHELKLEKARREKIHLENVKRLEEFLLVEHGYIRMEDLLRIMYKYTWDYHVWDSYVEWIEGSNVVISASSLMVKMIVRTYQSYIRVQLDRRRFDELSAYLTNEAFAGVIAAEYLKK